MLKSQIEIEWKFGIAGMLINLWCCMLGIENIEKKSSIWNICQVMQVWIAHDNGSL
jgi:hypothetical protein